MSFILNYLRIFNLFKTERYIHVYVLDIKVWQQGGVKDGTPILTGQGLLVKRGSKTIGYQRDS